MANPVEPFVAIKYPIDGEFAESVSLKDPSKIKKYMEVYNFVVIGQVLTEKQCAKSIKAMWQEAKLLGNRELDPDDSSTWKNENWPEPSHPYLFTNKAFSGRAFKNMVNKKVNKAFEYLFETEELIATTPVWSIKRPTLGGKLKDWYVEPLKLHLDKDNTTKSYDAHPIRYQASIALNDSDYTTGGFSAVPGCANYVRKYPSIWTEANQGKYILGGSLTGPLHKALQRIPIKAGDMVIWERGVCHANFPNTGFGPRITNFFTMVPARDWAMELSKGDNMRDYIKNDPKYKKMIELCEWDEREMKVLGLKPWNSKK